MLVPLFGISPNGLTAELGSWMLFMLALTEQVHRQHLERDQTHGGDQNPPQDNNDWVKRPWMKRFESEFRGGFVVEEDNADDGNWETTGLM